MAAALSRVYAGLCRRDRLTSKKCPFWLDSLFCARVFPPARRVVERAWVRGCLKPWSARTLYVYALTDLAQNWAPGCVIPRKKILIS
jgi:hypothetical protein